MKFWKTTLFSLFLICGLVAFLIFHVTHISSEDQASYKAIMDVSNSKTQIQSENNYTVKQLKEGTKKSLLLSQGDNRKIGTLISDSSTLFLSKENQTSQLIEEMRGVKLIYQEELIQDHSGKEEQRVLSMEADQATYYYSQEKLVAENVKIFRYRLPLHSFPKTVENEVPYFRGTASSVSIAFSRNLPTLQAKNLKAISL